MSSGRASRNYYGAVDITQRAIRINTKVARFPLSWQGRLRERLGPKSTDAAVARWEEAVGRLTEAERGGLRPDASDAEICHQADVTARDMADRLRDVVGVWLCRQTERAGGMLGDRLLVRLGFREDVYHDGFVEAMQALAVRDLMDARGLGDLWPGGLSSAPRYVDRWGQHRAAWLKRIVCAKFWRRTYRKLLARTRESVAVGIGLVRKGMGLYCSDEALRGSRAQDARNVAVMENVWAVNDHMQAYTLAELAAKGVANQEIWRHELLTRIAGFEMIAKDLGHVAYMVTVTCPSRFHAATTRKGRVVDNRKYADLTARDGQEYLSKQWGGRGRRACKSGAVCPRNGMAFASQSRSMTARPTGICCCSCRLLCRIGGARKCAPRR